VVEPQPEPAIAITPPTSGKAERILRAFFGELISRHSGRPATADEISAVMREDPSGDLTPPRGLLLLAENDDDVLGCAGLRLLPDHLAEVTRVFVIPAARGRGLGSRLLSCIEDHARQHGVRTLRLDTGRELTEALRLYARHGYREVAPFSQSPYTDCWFAKTLP
jgi:GNAT superfamily N-acetyltransferase